MSFTTPYNDYYEDILDTPVPPYLGTFSTARKKSDRYFGDIYIIAENTEEAIEHTVKPITRQLNPIESRFNILTKYWKRDTLALSSTTDIVNHISYQQVIGMGYEVLPYILKNLKNEGGYWYWALKAITGTDPVKMKDRGNIKNMKKAWIDWGKELEFINE